MINNFSKCNKNLPLYKSYMKYDLTRPYHYKTNDPLRSKPAKIEWGFLFIAKLMKTFFGFIMIITSFSEVIYKN